METSRFSDLLSSTTFASKTNRGGIASPAGEAFPKFPATVARFRICGDPIVSTDSSNIRARFRRTRVSDAVSVGCQGTDMEHSILSDFDVPEVIKV